MATALLYGHSQTGGMGIDLANALKAKGLSVSRVWHNGAKDKGLLAFTADLTPAQLGADKVYLYAGGNSDVPTVPEILALIGKFGADHVAAVVLPPVNVGRDPAKVAAQRARNAGNVEGLQGKVPVYSIEAPFAQFYENTDHVHLAAGSPASKALAAQIVAETGGGGVERAGLGWPIVAALIVGLIVLTRRGRV